MIALMWNVSVAIRRHLRMYMPTNIAIDLLRTGRGVKWAVPTALFAMPAYLFAAAMASSAVDHGGPGWLNILVLLCAWNAMKFAASGALTPIRLLRDGRRSALARHRVPSQPWALSRGAELLSPPSPQPRQQNNQHRDRNRSPSDHDAPRPWKDCCCIGSTPWALSSASCHESKSASKGRYGVDQLVCVGSTLVARVSTPGGRQTRRRSLTTVGDRLLLHFLTSGSHQT